MFETYSVGPVVHLEINIKEVHLEINIKEFY